MKKIYKISHSYDSAEEFIASDMPADQIADACVGLSFFVELETPNGEFSFVPMALFADFLCAAYGCERVAATPDCKVIDTYIERERRCGPDCEKYSAAVKSKLNAKFISVLEKLACPPQ